MGITQIKRIRYVSCFSAFALGIIFISLGYIIVIVKISILYYYCFINIYSESFLSRGHSLLEFNVHFFLKCKRIGIWVTVVCGETEAGFCHFLHKDKLLIGKAWRLLRKWIAVMRELNKEEYKLIYTGKSEASLTRTCIQGMVNKVPEISNTTCVGVNKLGTTLRGVWWSRATLSFHNLIGVWGKWVHEWIQRNILKNILQAPFITEFNLKAFILVFSFRNHQDNFLHEAQC